MVDLSTLIGIIAGIGVIVIGIWLTPGSSLLAFLDAPSAFITLGGAVCATFVNFPLRDLRSMAAALRLAFILPRESAPRLIEDFRRYADIARRDGILALERVVQEIRDPYLLRGMQLAIDGTDPEIIQGMMRTELEQMNLRHEKGIRVLKQFAVYAPAFGMIGTLIGLVILLRNLKNPDLIGPAMAVAIVTTFYGVVLAYLVAGPLGEKLVLRNNEESFLKEMMMKGVLSIQSGDNPRVVEQKLHIFL